MRPTYLNLVCRRLSAIVHLLKVHRSQHKGNDNLTDAGFRRLCSWRLPINGTWGVWKSAKPIPAETGSGQRLNVQLSSFSSFAAFVFLLRFFLTDFKSREAVCHLLYRSVQRTQSLTQNILDYKQLRQNVVYCHQFIRQLECKLSLYQVSH